MNKMATTFKNEMKKWLQGLKLDFLIKDSGEVSRPL